MDVVARMRQRIADRMPSRATARSWYEIRNATGDVAVLRIFDEIHWLWGVSADQFAEDLAGITAPEIRVEINSPGGDVWDGIAIYNSLRNHPAKITTQVHGMAASIASVIVQAGDRRVMLSGSQMMVHRAWGLTIGDAAEHRSMADVLEHQDGVIASIYAERAGRDVDEFADAMAAETWMTADEAVERGLADEVVAPERQGDDEPANRQTKTLHDQIAEAVDAVSEVIDSAERVGALRAEAGKPLSNRIRASLAELRERIDRLTAGLHDNPPAGDEDDDHQDDVDVAEEIRREAMRVLAPRGDDAL